MKLTQEDLKETLNSKLKESLALAYSDLVEDTFTEEKQEFIIRWEGVGYGTPPKQRKNAANKAPKMGPKEVKKHSFRIKSKDENAAKKSAMRVINNGPNSSLTNKKITSVEAV